MVANMVDKVWVLVGSLFSIILTCLFKFGLLLYVIFIWSGVITDFPVISRSP